MFVYDDWGTVCGNGWSFENTRVACRQLGLPDTPLGFHTFSASLTSAIAMSTVSCVGTETKLLRCPHEAVVVRC